MDREAETFRMWKLETKLLKTYKDKGYSVPFGMYTKTLEEYKEDYESGSFIPKWFKRVMSLRHPQDPSANTIVIFLKEEFVGIETAEKLVELMSEEAIRKLHLVVPEFITPAAKGLLFRASGTTVEISMERELLEN